MLVLTRAPLPFQMEDKPLLWAHAFATTDVLVRGYASAHGHLGTLDSVRKVGAMGCRYDEPCGIRASQTDETPVLLLMSWQVS